MPKEREGHDPIQEAQETGAALANQRNAELAAAQDKATREALKKGTTTPEIITASAAIAESKRDTEPEANERSEKEKGRRKTCLSAIQKKLEARETPIDEASALILSIIMEGTPGEWNEYDPGYLDLGKVEFDPSTQTITIRFECYGEIIGERVITLART
ncbi:MAG: hypothetical protein AAB448_01310 [Patescibacteria group bacterium]